MIKSMTGFGRAEQITDRRRITVEMKSVNHRYLDLQVKMPRRLSFLEGQIRQFLKTYILRGKVDIYITYEDYGAAATSLKYNSQLAAAYLDYLKRMHEELGVELDLRASTLARMPEVFAMEEQALDEDALWGILEVPLREACERLVESREKEGIHIGKDLQEKLDGLETALKGVEERGPLVVAAYREKIQAKVSELLGDTSLEESRIAAEVILYADKICNDEETVRLASHIQQMRQLLASKEGIGRKLDFLAQEMNREANTILSKSGDLETSNLAISLKTEIEKIREQIQNIE